MSLDFCFHFTSNFLEENITNVKFLARRTQLPTDPNKQLVIDGPL